MRIVTIAALAGALALPALGASAQTAKENFSYSAPSGMFSEGTTKWQNYRFQAEDAERTAQFNRGDDITTGSVQGGAVETEQYRRPGDSRTRRREAR